MVEENITAALMNRAAWKGDWREDGWTLVGGFLGSSELGALREEADRLLAMPELFAERGDVANSTRRSDRGGTRSSSPACRCSAPAP